MNENIYLPTKSHTHAMHDIIGLLAALRGTQGPLTISDNEVGVPLIHATNTQDDAYTLTEATGTLKGAFSFLQASNDDYVAVQGYGPSTGWAVGRQGDSGFNIYVDAGTGMTKAVNVDSTTLQATFDNVKITAGASSGKVLTSDATGVATWTTPAGGGGGDASTNTATSVDSEVALFSSTTGKLLKRATASGIAKLTSGVLSAVTAPSGAIVGDTDSQTLTNKTLTLPTIGGTGSTYNGSTSGTTVVKATAIAGTTTVTLPAATDTLVGKATTDTLTNKTLTTPIISSISNTGTLTLPTSTDTLVGKATTDTLTNKTFDTAGTGNVFKINGVGISANTGTGSNVLATSPTLVTPLLGTPTSGVMTNVTGTASGLTAGNVTTNANLTGPITSTGNATAIASQTGTGTKFVVDTSPTLVTPVLGVATATSINKMAITAPATSSTLTVADGKTLTANNSLTLAGTDTTTQTFPTTSATIARTDAAQTFTGVQTLSSSPVLSSGAVTVSGNTVTLPTSADTLVARATTDTLTNKRVTKRSGTTASSATPTINTDNVDFYSITALAAAITSFTTNLSGTPTVGQTLWIAITDNGTARAITWGASFEASTVALPTTTVISTRLDVGFVWNDATTKWRCVAVA